MLAFVRRERQHGVVSVVPKCVKKALWPEADLIGSARDGGMPPSLFHRERDRHLQAGPILAPDVHDDQARASAREGVPRDRRARLDRFLADRSPVMKFLSFLILDEAAVLPNVKMMARYLAAY